MWLEKKSYIEFGLYQLIKKKKIVDGWVKIIPQEDQKISSLFSAENINKLVLKEIIANE